MSSATSRVADDDLTAKARIRNAALELYAQQGEARTSMRSIAAKGMLFKSTATEPPIEPNG